MEALTTKLEQLKLAVSRTESIIAQQNEVAIERHLSAVKTLSMEADNLKRAVEEQKLAAKEDLEEVNKWNDSVDTKIFAADESVKILKDSIEEFRQTMQLKKQEKELDFERKLFETKMKFQTELQQAKEESEGAKIQNGTTDGGSVSGHDLPAKLPKLQIARFNGTYEDWPRFWNQFMEIIDKATMPGVTKFAYLKSFLDQKVKHSVEGLPFTNEGYNRAKSILLDQYGKDSEIIKAYSQQIFDLPFIPSQNPHRIHEFCDKLTFSVQSLQTMGKLEQVNGYVAMTLDKLPAIRGDLVRTDPSFENWTFDKLAEALRLWTRRNPISKPDDRNQQYDRNRRDDRKRDKPPFRVYNTQQRNGASKPSCVYCDATEHKSFNCTNVVNLAERRSILLRKRLCFNCTGPHKAENCRSKMACQKCNKKHHTSICDSDQSIQRSEGLLTAHQRDKLEVVYPVVLVNVNGIKTRALLDTGAGSSYASAQLISALRIKPAEIQTKRIEMMLGSMTTKVEMYDVNVTSLGGDFSMGVTVSKVNKPELMTLENPKYEELMEKYTHLRGVHMDDKDTKPHLPIHLVLGASEYARIKTSTSPKIALSGQPVAEKTTLGWTIMSPGLENETSTTLLTQATNVDFEQLCRLDVLGLADSSVNDQDVVYSEFKEQLTRHPDGHYETGLPWKGSHPLLPTNKSGSLKRLHQLLRKLERTSAYDQYDAIIQEQKEEGIVESAPAEPKGTEFYIPHRGVLRENAETTKLRIVYDASARESANQPSLNDCLHPGPPLQNLLWNVLIRARLYPVLLTGDLQKAFLQVRIKEEERDALRFFWKFKGHSEIETLRFTRALFGLTSSPFLLGGVIQQHLKTWEGREPELVAQIRKSLYVDDLITGAPTVQQTQEQKEKSIMIFSDAQFTLHKWKSNAIELTQPAEQHDNEEQSFAKQQLGTKTSETKLLGLPWEPAADTLSVCFPQQEVETTKRGVLSHLAKTYDPLGLVSPMTLGGKFIFRDICERKLPWDVPLPADLDKRWHKWRCNLPDTVSVKRAMAPFKEPIKSIKLHAFGDASSQGVCAAVYAVVDQESGVTQGLITSKSRLSKQNLTIPRLELVAGHMAANLAVNVREALLPDCDPLIYCWLDSTVALYWIRGSGEYRQFVANRVNKIQQHQGIVWHHVPTDQNPADLGSRGGSVISAPLWINGPPWLPYPDHWPPNIEVQASPESRAEAKIAKEILAIAVPKKDAFTEMLENLSLWKTLRVCAWIARFLANCKRPKSIRANGPLTTDEIKSQEVWWTERVQAEATSSKKFSADKLQLNLQPRDSGILECRGRLIGAYPIYLPDDNLFTFKFVQQAHLTTLHGGVTLTMTKVRETHWVPRLRALTKRVIKGCWGCKRFQAQAYQCPPPGSLPLTRTEGVTPYETIGVDFAGPIKYRMTQKTEGKGYLVLYACSLTRGVYLDLIPSLETNKFLTSLKGFIARRGRPRVIYSDNGSTFKAAADWLSNVRNDEKFHNCLTQLDLTWRFNLSRAPWWGGQFERLIGVFKSAFRKTVGNGTLSWGELSEVVLDVEIAINGRPLTYLEEDVQMPVLTPSSMLHLRPNQLPELSPNHLQERDLRKRAKYLLRCKEAMWCRWTKEYVRSLRERHSKSGGEQTPHPSVGDVVIIQDESRNRNSWKLGIVERLIVGRDGMIRGAKVRAGKGEIERAVQHLYPLELSVDRAPNASSSLDPEVPPFRPKRAAAVAANLRIQEIAHSEQSSNN